MTTASWDWQRRYRVWEANRKVFAFPENWIEPEERVPSRIQVRLDDVVKAGRRGRTSALLICATSTAAIVAGKAVAAALAKDLYRIDLTRVVSKYASETEKNLDLIFRAAEGTTAVLLFDEADALFGKRSETGHLLKRMEEYSGLTILATSQQDNVDDELRRRIRFVIDAAGKK